MKAKHRNDGKHGKRGMCGGNGRYNRAKLEKVLAGERVGDLYAKKNWTMGKN